MIRRLLLVLLIALPVFPQAKHDPKVAIGKAMVAMQGSYCASGMVIMPETSLEATWRYFTGQEKLSVVHVQFSHPCGQLSKWILHIRDLDSESDTASNLWTLNETSDGMDIKAVRGHAIDWRVSTR